MNFDMNNIIQDNYNNKSLNFNCESFKGLDDVNHKTLSNGFGLSSQLLSHLPRQSSSLATNQVGGLDSSGLYRTGSSMGMDNHVKVGSGLMRQNSSPAGFFSHITPQSGTLRFL